MNKFGKQLITLALNKDSIKNIENQFAGRYGEFETSLYIKAALRDGYYKILRNIILPVANKTTEIDCILIHEKGIFVFESKNYGGWIFGDKEQEKWCQSFQNGEKYYFYNPIKQNRTHCNAIADCLNMNADEIYSYIIFSQRCTLKKIPINSKYTKVIKREEIPRFLKYDLLYLKNVYTKEDIDRLAEKLSVFTNKDSNAQHAREVKRYKTGNICPKCGCKLLERNGKYGVFLGCEGYPKCTYTRKKD